jgi:hypothetical protein
MTPGLALLFSDTVVVAKGGGIPCKLIWTDFRFVNGRNTLTFVQKKKDVVVVFPDRDDKAQWLGDWRQRDWSKPADGIIQLRWSDVEVADGVPVLADHGSCALDHDAWFVGGGVFVHWDGLRGIWTTLDVPDVIAARTDHTVTTCGHCLYVCFGASSRGLLDDVWCHEPDADHWSQVQMSGDLIVPRRGHSCVAVGDCLYVFAGEAETPERSGDHQHQELRRAGLEDDCRREDLALEHLHWGSE